MNIVDLFLAVLLLLGALRGYWRGFVREFFALTGLAIGLLAAVRLAPLLSAELSARSHASPALHSAIAFVAIFVVADLCLIAMGALFDRVVSGPYIGGLNRVAGAIFGLGKGAAVLAAALLFVHLFPVAPAVDAQVMHSRLGPPLVTAAGNLLRFSTSALGESPAPAQS